MTTKTNIEQPVTVDHGDLLEAIQSAEAWAGFLRRRERHPYENVKRDEAAADRIDQAIHRLREQSYTGTKGT